MEDSDFGHAVRRWRERVTPEAVGLRTGGRRAIGLRREELADLRLTALRYPRDARLWRIVNELRAASPRFVELWEAAPNPAPTNPSRHKVIDHPAVGPITLECDTLIVASDDLRIMADTAEPNTEDAHRLELAVVLGTQSLIE